MSKPSPMKSIDHLRDPAAVFCCPRGVSVIEFALILPLFVGFALSGFEMINMLTTTLKVQRLATMTADMVAQRGASDRRLSEMQMYDILSSMDVAAQPLTMRSNGRIVVTAMLGEDTNNDTVADINRIKWQRFSGGRVATAPIVGCHSKSTAGRIRNDRKLGRDEAMFHVQVTYGYQPLLGNAALVVFPIPETITRVAAFRGRGGTFQPILSVEGYPALSNCDA